ncbi:hypothetical protein C8R46DRAFT_1040470 [Mycena filopes]|nr:hypothetical protein C8R46DRAFT_1040470 [Mycena filopes]
MPAPAIVGVYVLAAVGSVAAGLAFKEFVYEPHIAPRVERWAEEFLAKRQARRARRAVPVPSHGGADGDVDAGTDVDGKSTYELESLVENEVRQWRSQVDVSGSGLRQRKKNVVGAPSATESALDESNIIIPYSPMSPTHVLFDPASDGMSVADSPTSTSGLSSRVPTPSPHSTLSHSTFRTPPPRAPPTPEPSVRGRGSPAASASPFATVTPTPAPVADDPFSGSIMTHSNSNSALPSPHHVPSLSLSHPLDLDSEHDLELLSAPSSSRPSSPFSELSQHAGSEYSSSHARTGTDFHSFTLSPELRTLSVSGSESDGGWEAGEGWSRGGSESSWASAGGR